VGKLSCRQPGTVHFRTDRMCYMFAHPASHGTHIMMELAYADMQQDVRLTTNAAAAAAAGSATPLTLSVKVPHHLPAFDGYGEYEPQLRAHRISVDFLSAADLAAFRAAVFPIMQQQLLSSITGKANPTRRR